MSRALVTGASAGLGLALARRLLGDGWSVVGVDRDAAEPDGGGHATADLYTHQLADLSDRAAVDTLAASPDAPFDLVVLNAGISATGRFEAIPAEAHGQLLAVNAEAPLVLADALLARGLRGTEGRLVLIGSLSVDVGYPGAASYAASKEALAAYGRSLAKAGRRVTVVLPGPIRTGHAARHAPEGASEAGRMDPDDLARRILAGAHRGKRVLRPGIGAGAAGLLGRLAPGPVTRAMRRALFDRLDREVW